MVNGNKYQIKNLKRFRVDTTDSARRELRLFYVREEQPLKRNILKGWYGFWVGENLELVGEVGIEFGWTWLVEVR